MNREMNRELRNVPGKTLNSKQVARESENITFSRDCIVMTYDIVSLYPIIDISDASTTLSLGLIGHFQGGNRF
jgi:hypothetical protein